MNRHHPIEALLCLFAVACSAPSAVDAGNDAVDTVVDAGDEDAADAVPATDVAMDTPADTTSPAAACTGTFGSALTAGFGRLDGTVLAVVTPADTACPMPNGTHVIVEVTMGGAVYRVVVNVASDTGADPRVFAGEVAHALPAPAWSDGFHAGVAFDYATTLGLASDSDTFVRVAADELTRRLVSRVVVSRHIAVYAQGSGGTSVHDVHRFGSDEDGTLVLDPDGATPTFLVFHFDDQTF